VALVLASLLDSMQIDKMDDTGMWIWAVVLTVASLAVSLAIAVFWQKWRAGQKQE